MHERFFHRDLTSLDHGLRAAALDLVLTRLREHEQSLGDLKTSLTATLTTVEQHIHTTRYTRQDTDTRDDLREALGQLERGPLPSEGTLPEVSPFVGLPGLKQTRADIQRLTAELADAVLMRDHGQDRARYRLRPGYSGLWVNDRQLHPGDIVSLTLATYREEPERYERLIEEPSTPSQTDTDSVATAAT
jgi:hypothetical protein